MHVDRYNLNYRIDNFLKRYNIYFIISIVRIREEFLFLNLKQCKQFK